MLVCSVIPLSRLISEHIRQHGPLPWAEVMQRALYDPQQGYYGAGPKRLGREGDFFTSVQVGGLYGRLLAQLAMLTAGQFPLSTPPLLIEQGAHDGRLAADILEHCPLDCILVEPNPAFQAAQAVTLQRFAARVRWVTCMSQLPQRPALWICNELIDAFAVHRLQWQDGSWWELAVGLDSKGDLCWTKQDLSPELLARVQPLDGPWLEGQCIEINLAASRWLQQVAQSPFYGRLLIADYGMDQESLYSPERPQGTLRRYQQHRCDDHLLDDLGQCDLTSHVNFSQLRNDALKLGLRIEEDSPQGLWLTRLARPWIESMEGKPPSPTQLAQLRQFQMLTHPSHLGASFRILSLWKDGSINPGCHG